MLLIKKQKQYSPVNARQPRHCQRGYAFTGCDTAITGANGVINMSSGAPAIAGNAVVCAFSGNRLIYERNGKLCINLKCDPIEADFLRQMFEDIKVDISQKHVII